MFTAILLRANRHRLFLVFTAGCIIAALVAARVWNSLPTPQQTAYATLRDIPQYKDPVGGPQDAIVRRLWGRPDDPREFKKSRRWLFEIALQRPEVAAIVPSLQRETSLEWLQENIKVNQYHGGTDILRFSAERPDADEAKLLVDAVTDAYMSVAVRKDGTRKQLERLEDDSIANRKMLMELETKIGEAKAMNDNELKFDLELQHEAYVRLGNRTAEQIQRVKVQLQRPPGAELLEPPTIAGWKDAPRLEYTLLAGLASFVAVMLSLALLKTIAVFRMLRSYPKWRASTRNALKVGFATLVIAFCASALLLKRVNPGEGAVSLSEHPYFGGRIAPEQAERLIRTTMEVCKDCPAVSFNEFGECILALHGDNGSGFLNLKPWLKETFSPMRQHPERWQKVRHIAWDRMARHNVIYKEGDDAFNRKLALQLIVLGIEFDGDEIWNHWVPVAP